MLQLEMFVSEYTERLKWWKERGLKNNTKHFYKTQKENTKLAKFQGMEDIL